MENNDLEKIYSRLEDEPSKKIFEIRRQYMRDGDKVVFAHQILAMHPDMYFGEIEQFQAQIGSKELCIVGNSAMCKYMYEVLSKTGFSICYCQKAEELKQRDTTQGYIVFESSVVGDIQKMGVQPEKILYSERQFTGRIGWQYFDVLSAGEKEIFVDIGGYSGETSLDFIKWCGGKYSHIYIFEPNPLIFHKCQKRLEDESFDNVTVYPIAVSDAKGVDSFYVNENFMYTAKIDKQGAYLVETDTLDNMLQDKEVTFIKVDVEGAEFAVLEGAKQIIYNIHPKIAISVYHNPKDFYLLAEKILEICPDYKFKLRHYHTDINETILYAYCD